jgi:nicotinate-nucleotide--dimethylbenzimidazole phosphoribosyltransferase
MLKARKRLDSLSKPLGSLGRLEEMIVQLAGIWGRLDFKTDKRTVIIMCADNGVFDEGVSSCPKEVTRIVTNNFTRGLTGINVITRLVKSDTTIVDIGVDADFDSELILNRKIRKGTWNIARGPAMTRDEAIKAINVGIDIVKNLASDGYNLLGTGEMGIANTTTSSAIGAAFTGCKVYDIVGKGAGLTDEDLSKKVDVVKKALKINNPNPDDALDVLSKVGGFDIAGLTGCFLGAAICRIPIVIDGFISSAAALTAVRINPDVINYIFPSHGSAEPGSSIILDALGLKPLLNLSMRLGEGTGAAMSFNIFDAAISTFNEMGTFNDAGIEEYVPL